ncbi:hypothetical protein ACW4TU_19065 [Streptomyces sp. QTS52]
MLSKQFSSLFSSYRPATAIVAVLLFVPACSGADSPPVSASVDSLTVQPAAGEVHLPVNAYLPTVAEFFDIGRARTLLISRCMREYGLSFPETTATLDDNVKDDGVYGNARRYGVANSALVKRYGYHLPSTVESASGAADTDSGSGVWDERRQDPMYGRVLNGDTEKRSANGRKLPDGGCLGQAAREFAEAGGAGFSYAKLAADIKGDSFNRSLSDPAVISATRKWANCMRAAGYESSSPVTDRPLFDLDRPEVSGAEIKMALADLECKRRTRLVEIWSGFERKYQKEQITLHADEFGRILGEHRTRMAATARILDGS